jgi:hypothetical protein
MNMLDFGKGFNYISSPEDGLFVGVRIIQIDTPEEGIQILNKWFNEKNLDPNAKPDKPVFISVVKGKAGDVVGAQLLAMLHEAESKFWADLIPIYQEREDHI